MRGAKISDKYRRDSEVASWIHDDILKLEAELNAAWSAVATMEEDNDRLEAERDALRAILIKIKRAFVSNNKDAPIMFKMIDAALAGEER